MDDKAKFDALVKAGILKPDNKGGFTIVSPLSSSQMATLIALSWNALQAAGIDERALIDAITKEQALDSFHPKDVPTKTLTTAELQAQLEKELKLKITREKQATLDDWSKQFIEQVDQYLKNSIANDVTQQKAVDSAANNNSNGFPYIAAGFVTPQSSYPTNLSATYNGTVTGALANATPVNGTLTMFVNFSNLSNIPGTIHFNGQGDANFNMSGNGGLIGGQLSGVFGGQTIAAGSNISGQFYGPAANEAGGNWNLNTASNTGSGQFAAKR